VRWYLGNASWWSDLMDGTYHRWIEAQYGQNRPGVGER
jgi:hypothetical protein